MIAAHGLRLILTVLFAVVAAFSLYRAIRPGPADHAPADRLSHALHAAMGLAMLAMTWPWGMRLPAAPQVLLFTLATLWFLLIALLPTGKLTGGHPRLHSILHAVMMGAMAWMIAAMANAMPPARPGGSGGDMPGMVMGPSGSTSTMSLHGTASTVAGILSAVFLVTALWWLTRAFNTARLADPSAEGRADGRAAEQRAYNAGCHGGMALGMAVMLLMMT
jgi:hypothetical protein